MVKLLLIIAPITVLMLSLLMVFNTRSSPGLTICGTKAGFKTMSQLKLLTGNYLTQNYPQQIQVVYQDKNIPLTIKSLTYSYKDTAWYLFNQGKIKVGPLLLPSTLTANNVFYQPAVDREEISLLIATVSAGLNQPVVEPEVILQTSRGVKTINITNGQPGEEVDQNKLIADLNRALACPKQTIAVEATVRTTGKVLTENQKELTKLRAEKLISNNIKLTFEYDSWEVKDEQLINFLTFDGSYNQEALTNYAIEIAETVSREPVNASFQFESGRVNLFRPARDGIALNQEAFIGELVKSLAKLEAGEEKSVEQIISVVKTAPMITNKEVNDLGINELVGRGTSLYYSSIPGRIHNLTLASEKLNGLLIAPGEEFSFNKALGEVAAKTGYQQAYIIEKGRTVLGDGGGVCQTSTTTFRAVLNAGLPITERHAHAYRVHYYEDDLGPGYDATVFSPSVDFKFVNDTPAYLLIQTRVDKAKKQLIYELYGTSDGRKAEISKARIWARVPAPPDLYQDDPTLRVGVVKQIDWAAPGAKTAFDYKVIRNGEVLQEKTFTSVYRPWQAIYLRGTKL